MKALRVCIRIDIKTKNPILFFREGIQLCCYEKVGQHSVCSENYYYDNTRPAGSDKERAECAELFQHYEKIPPAVAMLLVSRLPRK